MKTLKNLPIILSEYYYAYGNVPSAFSLADSLLPELTFSEEAVPVEFSPTEALYFQDPEQVKKCRFVYAKLWAEEEQEILFSTISHSKYKIWLNGLYVGACIGFDLFTFYLTLHEGENILVFEVDLANPNYYDFNNRVVLQAEEEKNPHSFLCGTCLEYEKWIQFFQTPDCRNSDCTCVFVPRCYRIISSASVSVSDDFGNLLFTVSAPPGVPVTFPTEELKNRSPQTIRLHLLLEVEFTDGTSTTRNQIVWVRDYEKEKEELSRRRINTLAVADEYTKNFLQCEYGRFFQNNISPSQGEAAALFKLDKYLKQIENREKPYYLQEDNTMIYYRSALDLQYRKIHICTPPELSSEHPGLMVFVNPSGNSLGMKVAHLLKNRSDLILIDIAVAGFSTGTPISEALISEALAEVRKIYSFDERRIYWYGYCNSGSAVWSYCQNHPHLAARIVSVESVPDPKRIRNLERCKIISYLSEKDKRTAKHFLRRENNRGILLHNTPHNYMQFYLYRAENFQELDFVLPEYPEKVCFSTERMRFHMSFWITLNSIRKQKTRARVTGEIFDSKKIRIRLHNCDDFTLDVPPQMEERFTVEINGVPVSCEKAENLRFARENGKFSIAQHPPQSHSRKGTGLLDVYYGPLRIVYDESDLACEIAKKFAQPETMSFSPKLQVRFPIYSAAEFPAEEVARNLILINVDQVCDNPLDLPVCLLKEGFLCNGTEYRGDYCILQVVANPMNPLRSILHVGSNRLEKFKNHLLLRKIVLPSMLTGLSPYWNAEAICITEEKIESIGEIIQEDMI